MNTLRMRQLAKHLFETATTLTEMADAVEKIECRLPATELTVHMGFSIRTRNALTSAGVRDLSLLLALSGNELLQIRNFGEVSLKEVREKLDGLGIKLRED